MILGLASAFVYGAADFLGGVQTKRSGALAVVVWSQLAGLALLVLALALVADGAARAADLGWGAAAGVGGGAGVALLYRGLAVGRMSVVAPVTAVGAAAIPVAVGVALGERPSVPALAGVGIALLAIALVSSIPERLTPGQAQTAWWRRPGLAEAAGASAAFALFFVCLDRTGADAGLWPLLAARTSILVALAAAAVSGASLRPAAGSGWAVALVGLADMTANLLYLLAARRGMLSIVAVLVCLYPASTVLLARVVLGERFARTQLAGLATAVLGVGLIAIG